MSAGLTKEWGAFVDWRRVALAALVVGPPLAAVPLFTGDFVLHVLTIGAYYTTEAGFKDIGYIGNVARTRDEGPSAEVKAHLERELAKLGL